MADCNVSIDQENLPGVKEVCRDFAVLEDHCLAYNLQEQEIESHLASNVHKSRLVQQDLQVAKRLQEEEDLRAKAQNKRNQSDIERHDGEIAHEIQEELVRQEEQQRQQEEKDAAIARKLHEKEIKEERKRQKHVEPNFEDEYIEDHGAARRPLDLDRPNYRSLSPSRLTSPLSTSRDFSPEYSSTEPKRSRYPKRDPAAPHSHSKYSEDALETEDSRSRHADPYPDHLLPSRGKHRYPDNVPTETDWSHLLDSDRVVRRKERPTRPPPPQTSRERDKGWEWDRDTDWDRQHDRHERRGRQEQRRHRDLESSWDRGLSADRLLDQERHQRKQHPNRSRAHSRDRVVDEDYYDHRPRRDRFSWEDEELEQDRRMRGRRRMESTPDDVFEEHTYRSRKNSREMWEGPARERWHSHPNTETGRILQKGSGAVVTENDYRLSEATKGLTKLDIHEQELKDREVARKLHEEELRKNSTISRAAQVAQDEEIARLIMEQEKKDYKKQREREKERQREKERERERERHAMDRMAADRKRHEAEYRPHSEDVVRPRTRDELEYQRQKNHHKPARPPQPRPHEYANVNPAYSYPDQPMPPRAPSRPEPTSRGAYYKR